MSVLYLVRHGETTMNVEKRVQGHSDSELTKMGLRQAELLGKKLAGIGFSAIYSSDLQRAGATAEIINVHHGLDITFDSRLREMDFGKWQGLPSEEIGTKIGSGGGFWQWMEMGERAPGGESLFDVVERCADFVSFLKLRHGQKEKICVVGHGGSVRGIIVSSLRLSVSHYKLLRISNASLSIMELGDYPILSLLNESCHLDECVVPPDSV